MTYREEILEEEEIAYGGTELADEDEMAMIEVLDIVEYEEQKRQRNQQQAKYRQGRMQVAKEVMELEQKLQDMVGRCVRCYYYKMSDEHKFSKCKKGEEEYTAYLQAKQLVRYVRYAACWGCGCPQWICGEYLPGGGRQCQYKDIILAGAMVVLLDEETKRGLEKVRKLAERELNSREDIAKWLGEMGGIHGKQVSNAAKVFNELFN